MRIFSSHRKKLEPRRRFGGRSFRDKIKSAANYKRTFNPKWFSGSFAILKVLGVVIILVIFYYLFISPRLLVTNIAVAGNQTVSSQQIIDALNQADSSRIFLIKKNNYFLMTSGRVNNMITKAIPEIKDAASQRTWPDKISITVRERNPGFVIQSSGQYFLVDDEGVVVKQVQDPKNFLVAIDQIIEDFASSEALPTKLAPFVVSMAKLWPTKITTPIATVKFSGKTSTDSEFVSTEGWSVFFDTTRSAVSQLSSLNAILGKVVAGKDRGKLAYIDLRLSKWAYYCFKATPCSQTPQQDTAGATTNASPTK